jgi:CRP/FNR family transcriptional regulator, cyclic AMP receptor protein
MASATNSSCFNCELRADRTFCDLPSEALQSFDAIKSVTVYPRGATLFSEGNLPRGIFVLCDGRAKLSICSENGKRLMLRVAGPGEVLGLSSTLSGKPHEVTAEILDSCQVVQVKRKDLLKFLRNHREACLQVVHLLSSDLHAAYDRVRSIGLSRNRRPRSPRARTANA